MILLYNIKIPIKENPAHWRGREGGWRKYLATFKSYICESTWEQLIILALSPLITTVFCGVVGPVADLERIFMEEEGKKQGHLQQVNKYLFRATENKLWPVLASWIREPFI